jgi:integral membrane protein
MSENQLETRDVKNFLLVGKLEGYSYLILLFIAMPLKYFFDIPEAVRITGMLHGVLFVGFIFTIVVLFSNKIFNIKQDSFIFIHIETVSLMQYLSFELIFE